MGQSLGFVRDAPEDRLPYYRRRWVVLVNAVSGKVSFVDTFEQRLTLMRRRVVTWAEVVKRMAEKTSLRLVMVDLTYRPGATYNAGDIRTYLKATKKRLGENLLAWAWVAELQKRGEVHYHVIFAFKRGTKFPKPDDKGGGWPHGMSKVQTARTPFYLVTYIGKEYQKDLARYPRSCRLYAVTVRPKAAREALRLASGLGVAKVPSSGSWRYGGASVGLQYAEDILGPKALASFGVR